MLNKRGVPVAALVCFLCCLFGGAFADRPAPLWGSGDDLSNVQMYDENHQTISIGGLPGKKLIILTWERCGDCVAEFDHYRMIAELYHGQGIEVIFLWKDELPVGEASLLLPYGKHYYTDNMRAYTDWVPKYFVVDADHSVRKTSTDLGVIEEHLSGVYEPNENTLKRRIGSKLIFFTVPGCGGCIKVAEDLQGFEDMSIETVICAEVNKAQPGENVDPYAIFAHALQIEYFPRFAMMYQDEIIVLDTVDDVLNMGYNR